MVRSKFLQTIHKVKMGGVQCTHVANNSGHTAYVRVATERCNLVNYGHKRSAGVEGKGFKASQSNELTMTLQWNDFIKEGFERVPHGELAKCSYEGHERPFVTVVLVLNESKGIIRLICDNKRADNDGSYIFYDDRICRSKHGTIWQPQ